MSPTKPDETNLKEKVLSLWLRNNKENANMIKLNIKRKKK